MVKANAYGHGAKEVATALADSVELLQTCLRDDPDHADALWCLAAVRSVLGDREGLAAQAPAMNRPAVPDARFHYLGAACHLAAGLPGFCYAEWDEAAVPGLEPLGYRLEGGMIGVPDAPGFGLALDGPTFERAVAADGFRANA